MNSMEIILLAMATSLDSFAIMTCKGAMLSKINKKNILTISLIFGSWQAAVLLLGNRFMNLILSNHQEFQFIFVLFACMILLSLGVYQFSKGIRKKTFYEKREDDFHVNKIIIISFITSVDAFLVGISLAFLNTSLSSIVLPILFVNIISVILGIYTGYYFGYEQKTIAYLVGGSIFLGFSLEVLCEQILFIS